jgi:Flp pilus assembly protein TadG
MRSRHSKPAMRGVGLWRALWRNQHGGSPAIEMGLVAPALFTMLLGIAWFGYAFWLQNALDYAVTNAARCASVDSACQSGTPAAADATLTASYAASASGASFDSTIFTVTTNTTCFGTATYAAAASGAGFDSSVFTVTPNTTCGGKSGNLVVGNFAVALAIPFVPISLNLSSQACYPK